MVWCNAKSIQSTEIQHHKCSAPQRRQGTLSLSCCCSILILCTKSRLCGLLLFWELHLLFSQNAIHNHIRLFEPLVIKALKQYTTSTSVALQRQVLDLLAQLVQLRVNYCLLDSDQVKQTHALFFFFFLVISNFKFYSMAHSEIYVLGVYWLCPETVWVHWSGAVQVCFESVKFSDFSCVCIYELLKLVTYVSWEIK